MSGVIFPEGGGGVFHDFHCVMGCGAGVVLGYENFSNVFIAYRQGWF